MAHLRPVGAAVEVEVVTGTVAAAVPVVGTVNVAVPVSVNVAVVAHAHVIAANAAAAAVDSAAPWLCPGQRFSYRVYSISLHP